MSDSIPNEGELNQPRPQVNEDSGDNLALDMFVGRRIRPNVSRRTVRAIRDHLQGLARRRATFQGAFGIF